MNKTDTIIDLLYKIYFLLLSTRNTHDIDREYLKEEQMTRSEVKDYLGISESTFKRKVKAGKLRPLRYPGSGMRFYKSQLFDEFTESVRKGRV